MALIVILTFNFDKFDKRQHKDATKLYDHPSLSSVNADVDRIFFYLTLEAPKRANKTRYVCKTCMPPIGSQFVM
jgi:hypothetical protein